MESKITQKGSKRVKFGSKMAQKGSKMSQKGPKMDQNGGPRPPNIPFCTESIFAKMVFCLGEKHILMIWGYLRSSEIPFCTESIFDEMLRWWIIGWLR